MNDQQLQPTTADAQLRAEQEAESDAKKVRWFFIGFFGKYNWSPYRFYL